MKSMCVTWSCLFFLSLISFGLATPIKIGAFNIRIFGKNKLKDGAVVSTLIEIASMFDILLVQEIRDSDGTAFPKFVAMLNKAYPQNDYEYTISARLGRSNSKEQYAYLYRTSTVMLLDSYQYEDGIDDGTDAFEREPFAALFKVDGPAIKEFAMIGIHTKPTAAVEEIDALSKVYKKVKKIWSLDDILIAGDLNADCSYVPRSKWKKISLRRDKHFQWLIPDEVDTTVTHSDCTYDRFVAAGSTLRAAITPNSPRIFKFDKEYGLTQKQAELISDHYPIILSVNGDADACYGPGETTLVPTDRCWEVQVCSFNILQSGSMECKEREMFDVKEGKCLAENIVDCGHRSRKRKGAKTRKPRVFNSKRMISLLA